MKPPDHSEAITALIAMRDWDKSQRRPYGQYIALLALHEAGGHGLRSGELHVKLRTVHNAVNTVLAPLIKAGLVKETPVFATGRHVLRYALTNLGTREIEHFLSSTPEPAAV
jgi:DNA-binding MarR family transcriptional regulator